MDEQQEEANLSKLLSSLAEGVRAVHGLPLDEDELEYAATFTDFQSNLVQTQSNLVQILHLLQTNHDGGGDDTADLWESCADACDALLEQAELYLQQSSSSNQQQQEWAMMSQKSRSVAANKFQQIRNGIVEMEKPQDTYEHIQVDNDRTTPFVPSTNHRSDDIKLVPGRAQDGHYGGDANQIVHLNPETHVGPDEHCPHLYREQILQLANTYPIIEEEPPAIDVSTSFHHEWIDTPSQLQQLANAIDENNVTQIAVDLEAHSYRSFAGMVCLMQLSYYCNNKGEMKDYLIDTLALWKEIPLYLGSIFVNPSILKVFHGADSDVQWLQRDFGMYIVNLLDTGRAARLLKLPSFGLAHLLQHYAKVETNKQYQLSDWRQRPLPTDMQHYAVMDTHYLLPIAQQLLFQIQNNSAISVDDLFQASQQVALIRYDKEVFKPLGYKNLIKSRGRSKTSCSERQELALCNLYNWRDATARLCDESVQYVCPNALLLRLALACPTTVTSLTSLLNPMPPLVLACSTAILECCSSTTNSFTTFRPAQEGDEEEVPIKDTSTTSTTTTPRSLMMSPVLGTEALYKQAGWMTPSVLSEVVVVADDDEDEEMDDENVATNMQPSSHSLVTKFRNATTATDGSTSSRSLLLQDEAGEAAEQRALQSAINLRKTLEQSNLMALISPAMNHIDDDEDEEDDDDDDEEEDKENDDDDEPVFEIPRSMREIYRVSNRNRRNKKGSTAATEEDTDDEIIKEEVKKDVDTLEGANAILKARGIMYFSSGDAAAGGKRQKQEEEDVDEISQDEDISFMHKIGWIKDKEEAESLKPRPRGDSEEYADGGADEDKSETDNNAFGTATTVTTSSIGGGTIGGGGSSSGAYDPMAPPPSNPFFTGAAATVGEQQTSFTTSTTTTNNNDQQQRTAATKRRHRARTSRGTRQERPDRNNGRTAVYKSK